MLRVALRFHFTRTEQPKAVSRHSHLTSVSDLNNALESENPHRRNPKTSGNSPHKSGSKFCVNACGFGMDIYGYEGQLSKCFWPYSVFHDDRMI